MLVQVRIENFGGYTLLFYLIIIKNGRKTIQNDDKQKKID